MLSFAVVSLLLSVVPAVWGHANITTPLIRAPGPAHLAACGQKSYNELTRDRTGHIEDQMPVTAGCNIMLCRGMLLADQPASEVLTVAPGSQFGIDLKCSVSHGGPANVTLVDTTTGGKGTILGGLLKTWDNFCPVRQTAPVDQTAMKFMLPNATTIGTKCQKAGDCVVQLFWATPDYRQNYYYCVDVVVSAPPA